MKHVIAFLFLLGIGIGVQLMFHPFEIVPAPECICQCDEGKK